MPGDCVFTHCDLKPENCLTQRKTVAVLDWDECGFCHPRLEAVEAAVRWAGGVHLDASRFATFLAGYNSAGPAIDSLEEHDFAKWVAALVGWFTFQAGRCLGDWPNVTQSGRESAAAMACNSLVELEVTLKALPRWAKLSLATAAHHETNR